jgi:predicted amidohydrolase
VYSSAGPRAQTVGVYTVWDTETTGAERLWAFPEIELGVATRVAVKAFLVVGDPHYLLL